ncbi:hypothetical protein R1flu_014174 [Riccia fluitans]|uniref:Glycoside hydrolase family 19 catalytic domain-containing protein n=1 Tax=Riccia fluitans TaxID=41844 RepID=A0ABD1YFJ1_9MARC
MHTTKLATNPGTTTEFIINQINVGGNMNFVQHTPATELRVRECRLLLERVRKRSRIGVKMETKFSTAAWLVAVMAFVSCCNIVEGRHLLKSDDMVISDLPKPKTVEEIIPYESFNAFFPHRNDVLSKAQGFWTYESFIQAATMFKDFGTIGGEEIQKREIAAFMAHVARGTTCGWANAKDGPYAWGLCYYQELSPSSLYCKDDYNYPCVAGVSYHGRGAFPIYWNFNYGPVGKGLKVDLLNNPGLISSNSTLAWASAMWYWMTPQKPNPSPHSVMVGEWEPTADQKNGFIYPGFGVTTNILNGQIECGHGDDWRGQERISFYKTFGGILGVQDFGDNLDCEIVTFLSAFGELSRIGISCALPNEMRGQDLELTSIEPDEYCSSQIETPDQEPGAQVQQYRQECRQGQNKYHQRKSPVSNGDGSQRCFVQQQSQTMQKESFSHVSG